MAQAVGDNAIVLAHQGRDDRLVGGKAGDKQQRARVAQPVGKRLFQRLMRRGVSADVSRSAAAHAKPLRALLPGADNGRMLAEPEIVVAGEIAELLAFTGKKTARAVFHHLANAECLCRPTVVERRVDTCLPGHTAAAL